MGWVGVVKAAASSSLFIPFLLFFLSNIIHYLSSYIEPHLVLTIFGWRNNKIIGPDIRNRGERVVDDDDGGWIGSIGREEHKTNNKE